MGVFCLVSLNVIPVSAGAGTQTDAKGPSAFTHSIGENLSLSSVYNSRTAHSYKALRDGASFPGQSGKRDIGAMLESVKPPRYRLTRATVPLA
jgi:hypothetical protein